MTPEPTTLHDVNHSPVARPDFERARRKGVPEVILTDTKTVEQSMAIAASFLEKTQRAILSRVSAALYEALQAKYGAPNGHLEWHPVSRMAIVRENGQRAEPTGGRVGVLTAGTSDQPVAEEATLVALEMGCEVKTVYDVGVAGLHRLFDPLDEMMREGVDVIVVAAGMDGALPSVVTGLVQVPVIGLPTSVGYGMGGRGEAALLSMLQTCVPGLTVVNIDNGIGAGATAGIIANRCAAARKGQAE